VLANIERIETARREANCPQPIVIPSMTRCAATQSEIQPFFDRWTQTLGWASIRGYDRYCDALPPDDLMPLTPLVREPCRRIESGLMLLAGGGALVCSEDMTGAMSFGDGETESLRQIWRSQPRRILRESHSRLALGGLPACQKCGEWFRP